MIGKNLKQLRIEKDLTQKELANMLMVSTITIQNYENNRRQPNIETLNKIANALNVNVSELISDKANLQISTNTLGENIKRIRKKRGLTQKQLSEKINKHERMVQKYETGNVIPSIEMVNNIALALDTDISKLIPNLKQKILADYTTAELITELTRRCDK